MVGKSLQFGVFWLVAASVSYAHIEAEIAVVGCPGDGAEKSFYRIGAWAGVAVKLNLKNEAPRNVYLRVEQTDLDGDIVYTERLVSLTPDLQDASRPYWLYFIPNPETGINRQGLSVQVLNEKREAVEVVHNQKEVRKLLPAEQPEVLDDQHFLVLNVSDGTAGKIRFLSDFGKEDESRFKKPLRIAHMSPDLIPDHWHGLEMVDAIVWDDAAPSRSGLSVDQQNALLDWVRHGGRLLVASGSASDELAKSAIHEYLPVEIQGVKAMDMLPDRLTRALWRRGGAGASEDAILPQSIQMTECRLREGAIPLVQSAAKTQTFLATRPLDNGSITFLAVTFKDLFTAPGSDPAAFFTKALGLRTKGIENSDSSANTNVFGGLAYNTIDLFDRMHERINFQTATAVYMLIAIVSVILYALAATWGSWFVLKRRGILRHSWTVFSVVALAASLVSLLAVQLIRGGVGQRLHQISIVDTTVNTYSAAAHVFFGIKTSNYVDDLQVWLPNDSTAGEIPERSSSYLRPLTPVTRIAQDHYRFADTRRYRLMSTSAAMSEVPIRATLKQMEGYWQGTMAGQAQTNIALVQTGGTGQKILSSESTFTNQLGTDLRHCYLIESSLDPEAVPGGRGDNILIHPLGIIQNGETVNLFDRLYAGADIGQVIDQAVLRESRGLKAVQKQMVEALSRRLPIYWNPTSPSPVQQQEDEQAIMLLTLFDELEPDLEDTPYGELQLLQTNSRWLDRSSAITTRSYLLIGFSDDAGPVQLHHRYGSKGEFRALFPKQALTVYRILLPILDQT